MAALSPAVRPPQSKAWTAAAIGAATSDLQPLTAPGQPIHGRPHAAGPNRPITPVPGGVPLHATKGELLGGIGIGGAPAPNDDHLIAEAATARHGAADRTHSSARSR